MKYSELKAERKERAKATKERKAAEKKASAPGRKGAPKQPAKGNSIPGKKAASPGQQQRPDRLKPSAGKGQNKHYGSRQPRVSQPQVLNPSKTQCIIYGTVNALTQTRLIQ